MPKILIADDNSNIQKMVVLALKDQGIDVVAVGNGEAAVRKISDVRPDLVLADVFMPVRNGYEVCKFVKDNASLSHVPVILLVGAFDPLDEQEAQRVGADGVLKKPFVPPDPLISMVKSALTRSGVSLDGSNATPPPPPPVAAAKPEPFSLPKVAAPVGSTVAPVKTALPEEDFVVASTPVRAPLSIEPGAQAVAFGNLLDSAATEEDAVFSIASSTGTVPDRDWSKASGADEPEEEEEEKSGAWRLGSEEIDAPAGQKDWRETTFGKSSEETVPASPAWAPPVEKTLSSSEAEAAALEREQRAFSSPIGESTQPDWAKEMVSAAPEAHLAGPAHIANDSSIAATADETVVDFAPPILPPDMARPESIAVPEPAEPTPEAEADSPAAASGDSNLFASSSPFPANHPWEAALNRANDLASSWDTLKLAPGPIEPETPAIAAETETEHFDPASLPDAAQEIPQEIKSEEPEEPALSPYASESLLAPVATEELKEEMPSLNKTQGTASTEATVAQPASEVAAPATTLSTDELVAQVLAKMNPEVLQAVTREILKPIVQAMVKEQLEKK